MTELDRYLKDVETIRSLMVAYDERPIVEHWVYAAWGLLVVAGSILNYRLAVTGGLDSRYLLAVLWLPIVLVGGLAETIGWLRRCRRDGTPLMTRRFAKMIGGFLGVLVVATVLVVHLVPGRVTPGIVLCIGALPILMYALMTYAQLFIEGFALLAVGIVLDLAGVRGPMILAISGVVSGLMFSIAGLHSWLLERAGRPRGGHSKAAEGDGES